MEIIETGVRSFKHDGKTFEDGQRVRAYYGNFYDDGILWWNYETGWRLIHDDIDEMLELYDKIELIKNME